MGQNEWESLAKNISGDIEIEKAWLRKVSELYLLFSKKHHDYGRNNIGITGEEGIKVRLADKVSRLFELQGKDPLVKENIRDTWMDIAIYGIIALMAHDGDWPKVEPREVWKINDSTENWTFHTNKYKQSGIDLVKSFAGGDYKNHKINDNT